MGLLRDLLLVYIWVLVLRAILSWVLPPNADGFLRELNRIVIIVTEPLLSPIRRLLPMMRVGGVGVDLSIFILIIVLEVVRAVV
jgi:YggT family protein